MSARMNIAVVAVTVFMMPAPGFAQSFRNADRHAESQPRPSGNAVSGAYAATNKSQRATRPAPRGSISHSNEKSLGHVIGPDGRYLGTDPDPAIRLQLQRDGGMM